MSDVSGPGVASLGVPYLTGYPLSESGLYALARTWPAPEMPRPGCVWTHTLLIGFADLAVMLTPSLVTRLFKRPQAKLSLEIYAGDVVVEPSEHLVAQVFSPEVASWFERLASAVYECPSAQVWARRTDGRDVDEAVLRIWDQQWPRLKRSFRFCTLTSRDRSQEGIPFDLQLLPASESSSHLRFSSTLDGVEATTRATGPWLDDLLHDALFPEASSLRQFLRKLGADMLGGREAMRPFCSLHAALEVAGAEGASDAVQKVEDSPLFSASQLVKTIVVQAAIANLRSIDDHVLDFVIDNFLLLPEDTIREHQGSLAQLLWEHDPRRLIALGGESRAEVRGAVRNGALSIPSAAIIRQLTQVSDLAEPLLELLPAASEEPLFWSSSQLLPATATRAGIELSKVAVVRAMILGLRESTSIKSALEAVGKFEILQCLQSLVGEANSLDQIRLWLRHVCVDKDAVAQYLAKVQLPSRQLLLMLTETLSPDDVPNDVGADPWYLALKALFATEGRLPVELLVYGLQRALGRRSHSVEELLMLTFEPLHVAAVSRDIPEISWQVIEGSLPWAPFGQEWDYAIRLRRAAARKCNELQLRPEGLVNLVNSDDLFLQLVKEIWELWGGSKYLRFVCDALPGSPADRSASRRRILSQFIKQHSKFW